MFRSHHSWADAMAKYRMLEDSARACDWPCREPMKGTVEPKTDWRSNRVVECTFEDDLLDELEALLFLEEDDDDDDFIFGCDSDACVADYLRFV
ncbi:MAG: hypothetical protein IKT40_05995 [Bacilli bacterium]|nr:hypothetical protein [Bacilli bacterium]